MIHLSETDLIKNCQNGDKNSFSELYNRYIKKIYSFIYYKTWHKETAEDLTSQTFFKALRAINQCDSSKPFSPWIYRIASNTVIDHFRQLKPTDNIDDIWDLSDQSDTHKDATNSIKLEKVKTYLKTLPNEQREIIILRLWQDLSYKEISEIIGKNEKNCKVIFSRALAKLRQSIKIIFILVILNFL